MISVCIIGSVARESHDELSDQDLVVIGDVNLARSVSDRFGAVGWNIAHFTHKEFSNLATSHSLFVQHIKQDGKIVRDDGGLLANALTDFQPKNSYDVELVDALRPLNWVKGSPGNYWADIFAADVLYVIVRNIGILMKASCGMYEFDFGRLVHWIKDEFSLSGEELTALLELRYLKTCYRKRTPGIDRSHLPIALQAAKKVKSIIERSLTLQNIQKETSNGYFELRRLEEELVTAVDPRILDSFVGDGEIAEIWGTICNPSIYKQPRLDALPDWTRQVHKYLGKVNYH